MSLSSSPLPSARHGLLLEAYVRCQSLRSQDFACTGVSMCEGLSVCFFLRVPMSVVMCICMHTDAYFVVKRIYSIIACLILSACRASVCVSLYACVCVCVFVSPW